MSPRPSKRRSRRCYQTNPVQARSPGRLASWLPCVTRFSAVASDCGRFWSSKRRGCSAIRAAAPSEMGAAVELLHGYLARPRRSPVQGRRRSAPQPADGAQGLRRGDSHPRRRRPADAGLRGPRRSGDGPGRTVRVDLVLGLARAAGLGGMVGGQMLDLAAEGRYGGAAPGEKPSGEADVRRLQAMKTGALLRPFRQKQARSSAALMPTGGKASPRSGGRSRRGLPDRRRSPGRGSERGSHGQAYREGPGKATLVDALGMDGARRESRRLLEAALACLDPFGSAADVLRDAARFTVERKA